MILPDSTLGMLGGGQLGRMFTVAARTMGYRVIVLDPDPDSPAGRIADEHLHAAYTDDWALNQLAGSCAVVTTEFENVPAKTLRRLEQDCPVRPSARAVELTQDRVREKTFVNELGLDTAPFYIVRDAPDMAAGFDALSPPLILKRSSFGYDGKGQIRVEDLRSAKAAFVDLGEMPCVLEQQVDIRLEISVVLARSSSGESSSFPVVENEHVDGILCTSLVPASVSADMAAQANDMSKKLADALEYCGVMAVEFFVTDDGCLLVNEIAPRPHNSGHYTLDACVTSQFEQQVRMICGLPGGSTRLLSPVVMVNILGDVWHSGSPHWERLLRYPAARLHLYGKREARPGRKMGHFCYLGDDVNSAKRIARDILVGLP